MWTQLALLLLQVAAAVLSWAKDAQAMKAGEDAAVAKAAASILQKTKTGREIMAKVSGMTEAEVDAALRELEP